ncbi:MAG TPA: cytochrome c oxidase assembly protein [Thermoanaerobaculia bacterium]|jgi:cytochrome c oxidase assembly factor CtaG/cytochrome c2
MRLALDLLLVLCGLVSLTLYFRGARRAGARWYEQLAFALGWATILYALLSKLDVLSDILFSAHMTQHELLMVIAAPLLVAGHPFAAGLHGLPQRPRAHAIALARRIRSPWRALTHPIVVLIVHAVALWMWHIPVLFEAALANELIHAVQHLMFFVTAALFWWSIIHGRYGKVGYGIAVFFVFAMMMHTSVLGVLLTFANRLWYPSYAAHSDHALEDQRLAGLIMWIPAGLIFLLVALALFAAWLGESERRARISTLSLLLCVLLLTACEPNPKRIRTEAEQLTGGNADRGKKAIRHYGCGSCHTIPGIPGANTTVGPSLEKLRMRNYLAGRLDNTADNLIQWIRHPRHVDPKTAMPEMAVTERDGRDIAAYLYTLQ